MHLIDKELGKRVIDFDTKEFNFYDLILNDFNDYLSQEHGDNVNKLSELHKTNLITKDFESLRQRMFSVFRGDNFQKIYCSLGKKIIDKFYDKRALIQKTPTARIQPPQYMTTSFHCDAWYGHSSITTSFWMPLTKVYKNNTLHMAKDRKLSLDTLEELVNSDYDLEKINNVSKSICEPILIDYGQIMCFKSDMLHGAKVNTSDKTRVTFDFRILESKDDLGFKSISNYFDYNYLENFESQNNQQFKTDKKESSSKRNNSLSNHRFVSYSNSCKGVNAKSQLTLCAGIANDKKINITRNESEIYVFSHLPVLRHYLGPLENEIDGVIAFSLDIFEQDYDLAENILKLAVKNGKKVLFAAEDILVSKSIDIKKALELI